MQVIPDNGECLANNTVSLLNKTAASLPATSWEQRPRCSALLQMTLSSCRCSPVPKQRGDADKKIVPQRSNHGI